MPKAKRQSRRSRKRSRIHSKKCPKGQIRRKAHSKKSYLRRSYKRKDGTRVKASYVDRAKVPSTCVPDKGAKGKTPLSRQVLPKLRKDISLRRHGYSVHKSAAARHTALDKASTIHNPLKVLRHLNLARNYQADEDAEKIMSRDVNYMKKKYAHYKERHMSRGKTNKKTSRKTNKKTSRKASKKRSRKSSRKTSKRRSRK